MSEDNPLFADYTTPPFDRIRPEHYAPAIAARLKNVAARLEAIKSAAASFENTVVPLESLFDEAQDMQYLLSCMTAHAYTPELGAIENDVDVAISDAVKTVFQDRQLGALFQDVHARRDSLALDGDDRTILRDLYWRFESAGAFLDEAGQERIRAVDAELIRLAGQFRDNLLAAPLQNAVLIRDRAALAGLSDADIAALERQARAQGHAAGWLFVPDRLVVDDWLTRASDSGFRRQMTESLNRLGTVAPHDNEPVIQAMQRLRHEYASLLGYPDYAAFARTRTMLGLEDATALLGAVEQVALPKFEAELRALETFAGAPLEPWDVPYWAGRQTQALFGFDIASFSRYFPLDAMLSGLLAEAGLVGGLDIIESTGRHPVPHPDTRTFAATNRETGEKTILLLDLFARPGTKKSGAWVMTAQAGGTRRPHIMSILMNFMPTAPGDPPLIALPQLNIMYHEMGHAVQGLAAGKARYRSLRGIYGPADFIEIHSTINEPRAVARAALLRHARHVETGAPPDEALIAALEKSATHFGSRELLKMTQNGRRDLAYHQTAPDAYVDTKTLEQSVETGSAYQEHIRPYPATRFNHLFEDARGQYCAGYVNYLIAEVHAADGAEPFADDSYAADWLARLRRFYSPAAGQFGDWAARYETYRGRPARIDALLRQAGIENEISSA